MAPLDPAVARLKKRLLEAPYEICLARARHFTHAYQHSEGLDPHLRNARALARTLARQRIAIEPDERLAGSKTERFLAGPLSVERGDFLRALQLEIEVLGDKIRPFSISAEDRRAFYDEVLPYWEGRTVRDRKAALWRQQGLIDDRRGPRASLQRAGAALRLARHLGPVGGRRLLGANLRGRPTLRRLRNLFAARHQLAENNPTPAVYCFDVQGHLSLGVDKVVTRGMGALIDDARLRLRRLGPDEADRAGKRAFLQAVIISLEAAIAYAGRFARLARRLAARSTDQTERERLQAIAAHCGRVPRHPPRTFHEALQAVHLTLLVGEIQYGTHEVFAVGRLDQYLYPLLAADLRQGRLDRARAVALLQELFLKQTANVEPIPEAGMDANGVLGNSQHVVTIGGLTPEGDDATNPLTYLMLDAFEQLGGCLNQLSLRVAPRSPDALLQRAARVLRRTSGIALYNDEAIVEGLRADGLTVEDARDYCVVGCVETSGQSDTHGCPGGHELVLPAALWLTLSRGTRPPAAPGQRPGLDVGDPADWPTFDHLLDALSRQLAHQIDVLVRATAAKDRAYQELLPAPYVSALTDDCIARATDITRGGARYDFTSIAVRGLATLVDSLLGLETEVYQQRRIGLVPLIEVLRRDFAGHEPLRQRLLSRAPKYGSGDPQADRLALDLVRRIAAIVAPRRNRRGGRFRVCYYSYGNHVIDGLLLDATPDGRRRGEPISNGISPSNLCALPGGVTAALRSAAAFPPRQVSSGVSLNLRFHPRALDSDQGLTTFARMLRTYFELGGMQIQPNVVSTETLRQAQRHPERYRDLVVKVAGYSAYFTDLGPSIQQDLIARAEIGGG